MKLHFFRHGESTANRLREFANGPSGHPLTELGVEQARAAAHSLAGVPVQCVFASPVLRAVQTAQILAESLAAPLEVAWALREWDVGIYEGTTDPVGWALHAQVQEDWFAHGKLDSKMPGGESFLEIQARFVPFIKGLLKESENTGQEFVLVAHGGLYLAMLPVILTNVDYAFATQHRFPYTAHIVAETDLAGLRCVSWCGVTPDA